MTDDEVLVSVNDSCVKNTLRTGSVGLIVGKLAASLFHRYLELSFPENESSWERKVPGTKVPGDFRSWGTKVVLGNERSWVRKVCNSFHTSCVVPSGRVLANVFAVCCPRNQRSLKFPAGIPGNFEDFPKLLLFLDSDGSILRITLQLQRCQIYVRPKANI